MRPSQAPVWRILQRVSLPLAVRPERLVVLTSHRTTGGIFYTRPPAHANISSQTSTYPLQTHETSLIHLSHLRSASHVSPPLVIPSLVISPCISPCFPPSSSPLSSIPQRHKLLFDGTAWDQPHQSTKAYTDAAGLSRPQWAHTCLHTHQVLSN